MKITLGTRTIKTVEIYFKKTNNKIMHKILPQKAKSVDESIKSYELTLEPEATSYGRTILANNQYIGDVWCYAINLDYTPNAMISYCVFETKYWNMGIATKAVRLFIKEIIAKFNLKTISAFTFAR